MKQRLQHRRLEQAINHKKTLSDLLNCSCPELGHFCVADYIGNPALKQDRSTDNSHARGFFADQGLWREAVQLDQQAGISLAVFATFLVVEIDAGTEGAEFVVLVPKRDAAQAGGMYVGLMKSHNTDALCQRLAEGAGLTEQLATEVGVLLSWLRQPPPGQASVGENWFGQLFRK